MYQNQRQSPYLNSMVQQKEDPFLFKASSADNNQDAYGSTLEPSESFKMSEQLGQTPNYTKPQAGIDGGQVATQAATGAAMGGPVGAGIAVGGSLLSSYIAQKAADERAKREMTAQAYQKQASDEQNIINSIMGSNARALR